MSVCAVIYGCAQQQETQQGRVAQVAREEFFNYTVHFCAEEDCMKLVAAELIAATESVNCAFYGLSNGLLHELVQAHNITTHNITNVESLRQVQMPVQIRIVVDSKAPMSESYVEDGIVHRYKGLGIMHNKYCVLDNRTVLTGSFNPTATAAAKTKRDYNNLLIINSTTLAAFYQKDFQGLANQRPRPQAAKGAQGARTIRTIRTITGNIVMLNGTAVEAYFCPENSCAAAIIRELRKANGSIAFAAYSFTSAEIANELIIKASQGVNVSGIIEHSTAGSKYSKHNALAANSVNVKLENSKKLMHHKFFVIDGSVVITGSFNPTENADKRNAENIIIIKNRQIAGKYDEEFNRIKSLTELPA